jgi:NhaP-type Na+/H+ or K+/H+ antiporter
MKLEDLLGSVLGSVATAEGDSKTYFVFTFMFFLLFFYFMAAIFEKYKPNIGHETALAVIFGVIWSVGFYYIYGANQNLTEAYSFNDALFFDLILPPIIFNSGFSMKRKKFFENIGNIMIFGLVVTLVCFSIYSAASVGAQDYLNLNMYNYVTGNGPNPIKIPTMQMLLFTSLLCSSDVVAAVSIVDYEAQPKLYSCIFGEGVFNDIISIVLFNTVSSL